MMVLYSAVKLQPEEVHVSLHRTRSEAINAVDQLRAENPSATFSVVAFNAQLAQTKGGDTVILDEQGAVVFREGELGYTLPRVPRTIGQAPYRRVEPPTKPVEPTSEEQIDPIDTAIGQFRQAQNKCKVEP